MGTVVKAALVLDAAAVANIERISAPIAATVSVATASAVRVGAGGMPVAVGAAEGVRLGGGAGVALIPVGLLRGG